MISKVKYLNNKAVNYRILMVDADVFMIMPIKIYLSELGYTVDVAVTPAQALDLFETTKPQLLICDAGIKSSEEVLLIELFHKMATEVPIIAISSRDKIESVLDALKFGATDYLIKPIIDYSILEPVIESVMIENQQPYESEYDNAYKELIENLDFLSSNKLAKTIIHKQLLPKTEAYIGKYSFHHNFSESNTEQGVFIDYFEIDKNYMGFYIADLSWHHEKSVFAALLLKSLVKHPLRQYRVYADKTILKPLKLIEYLNDELIQSNVGECITLFYGVINNNDKTLTYTLAGHHPTPFIRNQKKNISIIEDGYPVGLFPWAEYEQSMIELKNDFRLVMFSDEIDSKTIEKKLSSNMSSGVSTTDDMRLFLIKGNI